MKILILILITICILFVNTKDILGASVKGAVTVEQAITEFYPDPDASSSLIQSALSLIKNGIPSENVYRFVQTAALNACPYEELHYYMDIVGKFHESGMPSELVMNTILEGIVKGVRNEKIQDSLTTTEKRLLFCAEIAASYAPKRRGKEDIDLLATSLFNALNSGFQEGELLLISREVQTQKKNAHYFFASVNTMMEIKSMGFRNQDTVQLIQACISNGFSLSDIKVFPHLVAPLYEKSKEQEIIVKELITRIKKGEKPTSEKNATEKTSSSSSDSRINQSPNTPPKGSEQRGGNSP
jgi:hypothetical protein